MRERMSRFNGAETKMSRKYADTLGAEYALYASMGPRQKCLGNHMVLIMWPSVRQASMGPRQKCLGNKPKYRNIRTPFVRLQWGRDKNVSEIKMPN